MKRKIEKYQVNLSESFMVRSRCMSCGKFPENYFKLNNERLYTNPTYKKKLFDKFPNINVKYDDYMMESPKDFTTISHLSFTHYMRGFNCKIHKNKLNSRENFSECLICPCGKSIWTFKSSKLESRKEIFHRKARYFHPKKFTY